ncbi:MAG: GTP-binding protein [Saprospiraceae bacterium]|nr:GTP-binding protein [Saprospiraceae bacterium]MDZ4702435.1 GTP-binding protein [Saprospiraceae bacterium]
MNILKFITAGSVDDGKSTLIGRLLFDSNAVSHDVLETLERQSRNKADGELDLSLLTDGLRAEREQGITIDVAYKYFSTARRKFIIADAPGHVQYTRNMVTGASNADLAIILVDARQGVVEQTHRHSLVASLMGIPRIVLAINKLDLVEYSEERFYKIAAAYQTLAEKLNLRNITFIPISALAGDNVVLPSANMLWYLGPTLLEHLETVEIEPEADHDAPRFQVQYVIRPKSSEWHDYRGYAGSLRSGVFRRGDRVVVLPAGIETEIVAIEVNQVQVEEAFAPQPLVLHLAHDIDVSRGDTIARADAQPAVAQDLEATLCWMSERPLQPGDKLLLRQNSATVKAIVKSIEYRIDVHTFNHLPDDKLQLNDIGLVRLRTAQPLVFDTYKQNRHSGGFILVNENTYDTVAAGMLEYTTELQFG